MSKLSEYIKLIPKGFKNLDKILDGLKNQAKIELGTIPEEDFETIVGRRLICSACPHMSENAEKLGLYKTDRDDAHCTLCSCPILTKTASLLSNCGIEEYNKENPDNPLPLKWVAVK